MLANAGAKASYRVVSHHDMNEFGHYINGGGGGGGGVCARARVFCVVLRLPDCLRAEIMLVTVEHHQVAKQLSQGKFISTLAVLLE